MTDPIKFMPPRVALTDPRTGLISREWYLFFQGIYDRIGGANGPTIPDVATSLFEDAGSGETNAMLFTVEDAVEQAPPYEHYVEQTIAAELSGLRDQVAELVKELDALKASPIFEPAGGASPSASVGLTAVSGVAPSFLRSDAAPALNQGISPTWTGNHTFNPAAGDTIFAAGRVGVGSSFAPIGVFEVRTAGGGVAIVGTSATNYGYMQWVNASTVLRIGTDGAFGIRFDTNATQKMFLSSAGDFGIGLTPSGTYKLEVNGALSISSNTLIRTATSFTNGAGAAAGTLGNAPVAGNPTKWVPINDNGTTRYIPCW